MATAIDAWDAEERFAELLARVVGGDTVHITKDGVPVAVLRPVRRATRLARAEAIAALSAFGHGRTLGRTTLRQLIDEGRE